MNSLCDADEDMGEASSVLGKLGNCDGAWGRALAEVSLQEAAQHGGAASLVSDLGGRRPDAAGDGRAVVAPAAAFASTARTPADDAWSEAVRGAKQQQKRAADDGGGASAGGEWQRSSDGGARGRAEMSDRATAVEAATRSHMPATREWMSGSSSKLDADALKRLVLEVTLLNKERWSPGTMAALRGLGEGEADSLAETLSGLSFEEVASRAFYDPLGDREGGDPDDPMEPDVTNLERWGVNERSREAKARIYSEKSKPKIQTALNRYFQFAHDVAKVGPIRPRIHESQEEQFMKECFLKSSFISWCTLTGCSVRTAEGYFSLIQSWHADTIGYKIAETPLFTDYQFSRNNRGLRRLLPHQKMDRIAHPTAINEPVLRSSLKEVLEVYDEGPLDDRRLAKIRLLLAGSPEYWSGSFDKVLYDDLFYSALTEFMTDGLLRPSEALPNTKDPVTGATIRSYIHHEDVSFTFDKKTQKLVKVQVMVTPIKQYGDKVGSTDKVPVVVSAFRGGNLRSAELLHILMSLSPAKEGQEATTPAFRYAREMVEMTPRERNLHQWISHRRVMKWYRSRCEAAGVNKEQSDKVKMHSFRIGGATAMMAAGVSAEEIKVMGRWASDVYQIYCRVCEGRLLHISQLMATADTTQFIGRGDSFFNAMAGVNAGSETLDSDDESEQTVTGGARACVAAAKARGRGGAGEASDDSEFDDSDDEDYADS